MKKIDPDRAVTVFASQKGLALLMVLWVLTILMVVVFSFSYMARTEAYASLSFRQTAEKKFLAEAGIQRGIMELFYKQANMNQKVITEETMPWKTDGSMYTIQTDNGYYTIRITDESGKVDINTAPEVILKTFFMDHGLKQEAADTIVDSIMDWKDPDNLTRLHGAEDDYYMSLPNPYKAKNADFETLEELLLVKGITPEILYGTEGKRGIIDFLTVNSKGGKINPYTAPREVLEAIPGMSDDLIDAIITNREVRNIQALQQIIGQSNPQILPYISMTDTGKTFTIESAGFKGAEKTGYTIRATVTLDDNSKYRYLYYKSPVDVNI